MALKWPQGNFYMPFTSVGGDSRNFNLLCKVENGSLVQRIGVYYDADAGCIQGIHVTYTDDTDRCIQGKGVYNEITLEPGETITEATLWDTSLDRGRTRVGRLKFKTSRDHTYDVGRESKHQKRYTVQVGSGYLVGFMVGSSYRYPDGIHDVEMLACIFLKPIKEVLISHVEFIKPLKSEKIRSELLASSKFVNNCRQSTMYEFANSVDRTSSHSLTSSTMRQFSNHLRIKIRFPTIFEVGGEIGWETGDKTITEETKKSVITKLEWKLSGKIRPGESVACTSRCQHGEANIDYNCRITITFVGATDEWMFHEGGSVRSSVYAFANAEAVVSKRDSAEFLAPRRGPAEDWVPKRAFAGDWSPKRGMAEDWVPKRGMVEDWGPKRDMLEDWGPKRGYLEDWGSKGGTAEEWGPKGGMAEEWGPKGGMAEEWGPKGGMAEEWGSKGGTAEEWVPNGATPGVLAERLRRSITQ